MTSREQTRQNYDRMSRWYDLFAASERKFTETGLQILGVNEGEHVLEIGSGTGHSLATLAQQVGESGLVAGVELSLGMIQVARKRIRDKGPKSSAQLLQGDGTRLPFASDSFEALFLSFTLELFSDEEILILLDECHRVLTREGRLGVVSLEKKNVLACRVYEWGHEHWPDILDCRPIELCKSLETGGFRVQASKSQTMLGLPVKIALGKPL